MKYIKSQIDMLLCPEEEVKAPSDDRIVPVNDHAACGDFVKPGSDEETQ